MMVFTIVVLPTPLRPSTAADAALRQLEIDALQDVAGAVMRVEALDLQHQAKPPR